MVMRRTTRAPAKRGAALAQAASAVAAAAAQAGNEDDEDGGGTTAAGERLTDVAADTVAEARSGSTREPRATIKRLNDSDGKYAMLDSVDATNVTEEWVAKNYGGGKYRVLIHGPTVGGRWGYIGSETYEIDASIPFRGSMMGRAPRATIHNPDGTIAGSGADDMAMLMKTQIVELVQSSADLRQRDREASSTQTAMLMKMMDESSKRSAEFMQLMLTMMSAKPTGPSIVELLGAISPLLAPLLGSRKDPMDMAMQLMTLTGNKGGGSQLTEIISAVKELRETAGLFGPAEREPEDSSLLGTITRMAPQLLTMLSQQKVAEVAGQPPVVAAPVAFQPNPPAESPMMVAAPVVGAAEGDDVGLVTMMLKPYASMLVERAMADDDPHDLGYSVALMIPMTVRNAVAAFIAQENAAAEVIAAIPALAPYPAWVGEFIEGVRERFNPSEDEDGDDEPAPDGAVAPQPGVLNDGK